MVVTQFYSVICFIWIRVLTGPCMTKLYLCRWENLSPSASLFFLRATVIKDGSLAYFV